MFDFRLEEGKYGKRFVPKGKWTPEMTEYCLSNGIRDVYLNIAFGWPGYHLSFVKDMPELLGLKVLTDRVDDLPVIESLTKLRYLSLNLIITERIDFSHFLGLEEVYLEWSPRGRSVFGCTSLRRIGMSNYRAKERDLSAFCSLPSLEFLGVGPCNITSIGDLSCLMHLRELAITHATKLVSLDGIEGLRKLQKLEISTSRKFTRIDPIGKLESLEQLWLFNDGNIETIQPLRNLKKLREFFFYESTNIVDGDLTPLKDLPNLKNVPFGPRRHYNLRPEDFPGNERPPRKELSRMIDERIKKALEEYAEEHGDKASGMPGDSP